jgi:hypothetical protein
MRTAEKIKCFGVIRGWGLGGELQEGGDAGAVKGDGVWG